uniref:Synaptosome associated protein 23.2 n=1 Tax=Sinocyclocheilus anshuiensis TaxID=1608454 RepID=A0A671RB74_9TELE
MLLSFAHCLELNLKRVFLQSLNVGVKTMTMLDEQGEKLKNVEQEMDQIKEDMKQARKNLNELSKCCGLCLCPFNRITNDDREDEMEENLNQMGNHIKILKNMALDFGDRIDDHIKIIDDVNDKVLSLNDKMEFTEVKCICDSRHLDLQYLAVHT